MPSMTSTAKAVDMTMVLNKEMDGKYFKFLEEEYIDELFHDC